MAKRHKESSPEYFKSCYEEALQIPFPKATILPAHILAKMQLHCIYYGTSVEMMLAALLPATAAMLGTQTRVRTRDFGDDRLSVTSLYSIASAGPGSGKSAAFRVAVQKPISALEDAASMEWLLKDFTKQGILRQQGECSGKGIIGSDEIFGVLQQSMMRSDAGVASTGERQLMCAFWSGDGHSSAYGTKATVKINSSALCMGGFTQPDKLHQLVHTIGSSDDGLLDRILLWACEKEVYYCQDEQDAYDSMMRDGSINFTDVLDRISKLHEDPISYTFTSEAFAVIRAYRDELTRRVLDPQDEEKADLPSMANSQFHTRYMDNMFRLAVSLHVLFASLSVELNGGTLDFKVATEISLQTLHRAKALLDYLTLQKAHITQGALGVAFLPDEKVSAAVKQHPRDSVYIQAAGKVLAKHGVGITVREAKRTVTNKRMTADALFLKMQGDGMGTVVDVKRTKVFFKTDTISDEVLTMINMRRQQYDNIRKLPGTLSTAHVDADPYHKKSSLARKRPLADSEGHIKKKLCTEPKKTTSQPKQTTFFKAIVTTDRPSNLSEGSEANDTESADSSQGCEINAEDDCTYF